MAFLENSFYKSVTDLEARLAADEAEMQAVQQDVSDLSQWAGNINAMSIGNRLNSVEDDIEDIQTRLSYQHSTINNVATPGIISLTWAGTITSAVNSLIEANKGFGIVAP